MNIETNNFVTSVNYGTRLVLSMPHSGVTLPDLCGANLRSDTAVSRTVKVGVDACVPDVVDFHRQRYSKIHTVVARVGIDVSRGIKEVDFCSVYGGSRDKMAPHGLMWRATFEGRTEDIAPMLKRPYSAGEFKVLCDNYYHPYTLGIQRLMDSAVKNRGSAILVELHSLPPVRIGYVKEGINAGAYVGDQPAERGRLAEGKMPDLILIDNQGRSCAPEISQLVIDTFEEHGLIVERVPEGPLSGDRGATVLYSDVSKGKHVVALELVAHGIEIERARGGPHDVEAAKRLTLVYTELFRRLESLPL